MILITSLLVEEENNMVNTIIFDNVEYMVIDTVVIDDITYTLFTNINDERDFCFRKTIIKDGKTYYSGLSDRNEFEKVLVKFTEKMING